MVIKQNMNRIIPLFAALAIVAASCTEEEKAKVTVDPTSSAFDYHGGTVPMEVTSNAPWTASCDYEEVEIHPSSGDASASVTVVVPESTYKETQAIRITFTAKKDTSYTSTAKHVITLEAKPFVELSSTSGYVSPDGGGLRISLTSNQKWSATAEPAIADLDISPISGTYNADLAISLGANDSGSMRSSLITFALTDYPDVKAVYTLCQNSR